jgi:hypothetical protein
MRRIVPTLALVLFGCTTPGGNGHPSTPPKVVKVSVGGTVSGLGGHGLVLQNSGGDDLSVAADGTFTFATTIATGSAYAVTVSQQPSAPTQLCVVGSGSGKAQKAVTDISVTCTTSAYHVGGQVVGLVGSGLVLRDNGGDDLAVGSDGAFQFASLVDSAKSYSVSVATQPSSPSQSCSVSGASGTVGAGNVTGVVVNCAADHFTIGGSISGLGGSGLVLQDNGGDSLTVSNNGSFAFATPLAKGAAFAVSVATQPTAPTQICSVTQAAGTVDSSNITSVAVSCVTSKYSVGGSVSGVVGSGLVLQDNLGDNLPVAADGSFTFVTSVASGATYGVSVLAQPTLPTQTCSVTHGSGTISTGAVIDVVVSCVVDSFKVGGTVSGLGGTGLVLQNNGGDDLSISGDGQFHFVTPVASGVDFTVTVAAQPASPAQSCTVSGGSGTVGGGDVATVTVNCTTNRFVIGGTVTSLAGSGMAVALNGGDSVVLTADGTFAMPTTVADGASYALTVVAQPSSPAQTCIITNGGGIVADADVTNIAIACSNNPSHIGGTVTGLAGGGLVLENELGDDLAIAGNGAFTFATTVLSGSPYSVTIATQPSSPTQSCVVGNAAGNVTSGYDISNVTVTCTTNRYNISGTITGLVGTLVLADNGGDALTLSGASSFTFPGTIASGGGYAVTVTTQPTTPDQTCTVTSGSGTVATSDISDIVVSCVTNSYPVNVAVSGLSGSGLVLQNNAGDDLAVNSDGSYAFATAIASGGGYAVTIAAQPTAPAPPCSLSANASGTVGSGAVSITVNCANDAFVIGGGVSGLGGSGLVLQDNGGDDLAVNANGSFAFATTVAGGGSYAVSVKSQPTNAWQTCTVSSGSGTVVASDVTSVVVTCVSTPFTITVTVSGLSGSGLVLEDNGGGDLAVSADGVRTFATQVGSGSAYAVTVLTQPMSPWQTCLVHSGSGLVGNSDLSISVTCTTDTHTVGGVAVAVENSGLVLQDNAGNDLSISASGSFVFGTSLASGSAYAVTIATQPTGQYCLVRHGNGTITNGDVTSVIVTCAHLTNGSFETGDYSAWTLSVVDSYAGYDSGTWGILTSGTTVNFDDYVYDYFTQAMVQEESAALPETFSATDGNFVAVALENGPSDHRIYQDVIVPLTATNLCWDMMYANNNFFTGTFEADAQYIAVNLRDVDTDTVLATLYKTTEGIDAELVTTMTTYTQDISAYRGRLVRLDFEINSQHGYLDTAFDHIAFQ